MKEKTFTSAFIQKSLAMSYFNVQQILGKMEKLGMVSPEKADKTREVLIAPGQMKRMMKILLRIEESGARCGPSQRLHQFRSVAQGF
jgi:hypothetical protein